MHQDTRRAGVLIPLFSLRSARSWGCGDIGDLVAFGSFAARAGLALVQLLPVNATTGHDPSPYAAISAFAIDPIYLALDACADFAGLSPAEEATRARLAAAATIDWPAVRALRSAAAAQAFRRFLRDEWEARTPRAQQLQAFREAQRRWLDDFALFVVLHAEHGTSWVEWPEPLRRRDPGALAEARARHEVALLEQAWLQWQLDLQWHAARAELAEQHRIQLVGDLPFGMGTDSADVWSHPEVFRRDLSVGTPPDHFSETGQDWGLPAYDWDGLARTDFAWMHARAERAGELYSAYRVDHVIGLYRTFVRSAPGDKGRFLPADEKAQVALGERILELLSETGEVIAEDLGAVPEFLPGSLEKLQVPGYRVLRWDKRPDDSFRPPGEWPLVSVATNGTHDTDSSAAWYDTLTDEQREQLAEIPGLELAATHERFDDEVRDALLAVLYGAPSELVLVPFQDLIGASERINVPGTVGPQNWTYRMSPAIEELAGDERTLSRLRALAASNRRSR